MNSSYFFDELNSLLEDLDSKYDINWGGCCYIAYLLAKEFDALKIKYKFITLCDTCHCALYIPEYDLIVNSADYDDLDEYQFRRYKNKGILKYYKKHLALDDWNPKYSRRWNLIVESILHSKISKLYANCRN